MRILFLVFLLGLSQRARADWFAEGAGVYTQASTTGDNIVKKYSGPGYKVLLGYSTSPFFAGLAVSHVLSTGEGEAGDITSFGADAGLKFVNLVPYVGYDFKFQYSADIVAASNGTRLRAGIGFMPTSTLIVKAEYGQGTFTNIGGMRLANKVGMNTISLSIGAILGAF